MAVPSMATRPKSTNRRTPERSIVGFRDAVAIVVLADGAAAQMAGAVIADQAEEHTSELQSLMRISYAVFCLKKKNKNIRTQHMTTQQNHLIQHNKIQRHTKHKQNKNHTTVNTPRT